MAGVRPSHRAGKLSPLNPPDEDEGAVGGVAKPGRGGVARLEMFSDGVFAIAITILALELRVPHVEHVTPLNLTRALLDQWPSYFAFLLSFSTILIMWINHHARLALLDGIDGLLMFGNGLLLMMVAALSFPTALVGEHLSGPAGKTAVVTYALFVFATAAAWNLVLVALKPERGLLRDGVSPELVAAMRRRQALSLLVYVCAIPLALVHEYLGLGLIIAMWGFWASIAYGTIGRAAAPARS